MGIGAINPLESMSQQYGGQFAQGQNVGPYFQTNGENTIVKANGVDPDVLKYENLIRKRKKGSPLTLDEMNFIARYEARPDTRTASQGPDQFEML